MESAEIIDLSREAIFVLFKVSMPILVITLIVGLVISFIQALTQIQEASISFVPKLITVFLCLLFFSPYIVMTLKKFTEKVSDQIINID